MKEESTSRKVVRNTLFNYLAVFSYFLIRFLSLPIIIHGLGNERYGIYATVMGVVSYVGLLDLGIGVSLTKFVAEYYAKKDFQRLNNMLGTALLLYLGLGILGVGLLLGFSNLLIRNLFQIPPSLWIEARYVFWISAFSLFNGLVLGVFGNLINGVQRQDISRTIMIGSTLLTYGGSILLVLLGYKLVAFVLYGTITSLLTLLIQAWIAKRLLPSVRLLPRALDKQELRRIANFSFAMFVNQLAARNMVTLDRIILGIFLPIGNVTLYAVGATAANICFRIPSAAVLASVPAASELTARNRPEAVQELILRGIKYTGLLAVPVFTVMGVLAEEFILLWMGDGYETSARIFQLLLVGYFFVMLTSSGSSVMVGIGKPYVNTIYAVVQILLCSSLMVILVHFYGLLGAAYSSMAAYTLGGIVYLIHSTKVFRIPFRRMINPHILGKIVLLLLPGGLWGLAHEIVPYRGLPALLAGLSCYLLLYSVLVIRYHIDDFDMEKVAAVVPAVRHLERLRRP